MDRRIASKGKVSKEFLNIDISTLKDAIEFVRHLPYGRNESRDFSLVLKEKRGTCSSKHALLKCLADEQDWADIHLHLIIYGMSQSNTPGIGDSLSKYDLAYIPEAHCVISVGGDYLDVTTSASSSESWESNILHDQKIEANDVVENKIQWHRSHLQKWLSTNQILLSLDELWAIREECIHALSH